MLGQRDKQETNEMNHLALGLCVGILLGLAGGNIPVGLLFGVAAAGLLDTWSTVNRR
jgi:hypothetical protein